MDLRTGEKTRSNLSWESDETPVRFDCDKCKWAMWITIRDHVPTQAICPRCKASTYMVRHSNLITRTADTA